MAIEARVDVRGELATHIIMCSGGNPFAELISENATPFWGNLNLFRRWKYTMFTITIGWMQWLHLPVWRKPLEDWLVYLVEKNWPVARKPCSIGQYARCLGALAMWNLWYG